MPQHQAQLGIVAHAPEVRERAYQLYKQTRDYSLVSLDTSVPDATLRAWSSRDKWKKRIEAENAVPGLSAEIARDVVKVITSEISTEIPGADGELTEQQAQFESGSRAQALRVPLIMAGMTDRELVSAADKLSKLDAIARKALKLTEDKPHVLVQIALLNNQTDKPARLGDKQATRATIVEV